MGKSNTELLKIAQSHLGQGGARFRKFCGLPSGAAWCNAYVDYVANEGGDSSLYFNGKRITYCPTSMAWCRKNLAQIPLYIALPMDIIYFDWEPNGVPNHIGFVRERKSDQEIYTIEGNTSGGIVAQKTRVEKYVCGVFRPHFKPSGYDANKKLTVDGYFGYNTIAVMQKWLGATVDAILGQGSVKALQKRLGFSGSAVDGSWGPNTSKRLQKLLGVDADGYFGPKSVKAFQAYLNDHAFKSATPSVSKPTTTKSNAQKVSDKARELAWPAGTPEAKYRKKGGKPTAAFVTAWKKHFPNTTMNTGCHSFVRLVLRDSIDPKAMPSLDWPKIVQYFRKSPKYEELKVNFKQSQLKEGDIRIHYTDHSHHIWIITKSGGKWYRAEANQGSTNDRWAHLNGSTAGNEKKHKKDFLFRPKG